VVSDILEAVAHRFRPLAEAKGVEFMVQIQARPTLMAQPAHLQSLWSNLIDNAIRYTTSGQIRVTLTEDTGQMLTTVEDTGIGISTEELARVFQEFYRTESAKAVVELGTGLGLPIVDQIVKNYHGTIHLDSVPGQGTTFTVKLPLVVPETAV
jgi:signal transduction histidine kinase